MGSGAARKRAWRQKAKQPAPTSSPAATWGSSTRTAPSFDPASRAQLLQGWNSFPNQEQTFTLNQEARSTYLSTGNESNRLRGNAVQFVSGGNLCQDNQKTDEHRKAVQPEQVSTTLGERESERSDGPVEIKEQTQSSNDGGGAGISSTEVDRAMTKQVAQLDFSIAYRTSTPTRRRSTSASSTSSGEVILFAGRGKPPKERQQSATPRTPQIRTPASLEPRHKDKSSSSKPPAASTPSRLNPRAAEFVAIQLPAPALRHPLITQRVGAPASRAKHLNGSATGAEQPSVNGRPTRIHETVMDDCDDDEEVLRDYIENVQGSQDLEDGASSNDDDHNRNHRRSGLQNSEVRVADLTTQAKRRSTIPDFDWSSDDLRDFDELDTSEDEVTSIGAVFSRRKRPSGLQYLVVPRDQSTDFAKWIRQEKLVSIKAKELIVAFEEIHPEGPDESGDGGDGEDEDDENDWSDSSGDDGAKEKALNDLICDQESEHKENERILNQASQMTDAELARMLSKQAELGLANDDIVLFDDVFEGAQDFIPFSNKTHVSNRTRSKQKHRSRGKFPSAGAFADVLDEDPYNGFDVMDFDRPSLKSKKKGRKSAKGLPFELEDDELEEQLAQSWANDRAKKALKKAERKELRQAGLLGPKSRKGRVDLETKNSGMDIERVKVEVRAFLLDEEREDLALAPMNSPQRAQVHLLAKALYLKSHSHGKGDARFPILTKTDFSGRYDEDNISQIDALLAQRKFSRPWGKRPQSSPTSTRFLKARRSGGGGGVAAGAAAGATYMDGDVVGASAPELGSENRGRAMLEKMGWSSGMGIGKVGNKGRIEVIKHVVKNSKAGLG